MISWWGLFQYISFTKYRLRVIVNLWIKINEILVSQWPSLSHSTASTGSNTWQCCLYLFSSMPRFSCLLKRANPSFSFYDIFATNFLNPIVLLYTGPPIHPTTKKLSAMACSLLLHLLPLPHPCSSTCGLGSSCQPGLCALSGSEVIKRFFLPGCLACLDEMVHILKKYTGNSLWTYK